MKKCYDYVGLWACNPIKYEQMMTALYPHPTPLPSVAPLRVGA